MNQHLNKNNSNIHVMDTPKFEQLVHHLDVNFPWTLSEDRLLAGGSLESFAATTNGVGGHGRGQFFRLVYAPEGTNDNPRVVHESLTQRSMTVIVECMRTNGNHNNNSMVTRLSSFEDANTFHCKFGPLFTTVDWNDNHPFVVQLS